MPRGNLIVNAYYIFYGTDLGTRHLYFKPIGTRETIAVLSFYQRIYISTIGLDHK